MGQAVCKGNETSWKTKHYSGIRHHVIRTIDLATYGDPECRRTIRIILDQIPADIK